MERKYHFLRVCFLAFPPSTFFSISCHLHFAYLFSVLKTLPSSAIFRGFVSTLPSHGFFHLLPVLF